MMFRSYLSTFVALLLVPALLIGMNIVFLHRTGEFMELTDIVQLQMERPGECLYRSAIRNDDLYYKLEGYSQVKPTVAAIGSSRALQFREEHFTESFYTLGNAMTSVEQGTFLVQEMFKHHKPDVLFIATDFWWFSDIRADPFYYKNSPSRNQVSVRTAFEPFVWLYKGRVSIKEYVSVILSGLPDADCSVGVAAWKRDGAFASDGSYYYAKQLQDPPPPCDTQQLYSAVEDIDDQDMWYIPPRASFSEQRLDAFLHLLEFIVAEGTEVVVLFTPLSQPVYDAVLDNGQGIAFTQHIKEELTKHAVPFVDAHNPEVLGISGCDFIDSLHGADTAYARMLMKARALTKRPVINTHYIDQLLRN